MAEKNSLKLSPSSLNLYLECPRCFWLRFNKGIKRPEGPNSTLPGGMDYTLKNYYDSCRKEGLPKELQGKIEGRLLPDQEKISELRKINFGFWINDDLWFSGGLDEAIEMEDGSIVPLDNKTKGFPPKGAHWTQVMQMSGYSLILRERGIKTKNLAFLVFWFLDHKNMDYDDPLGFKVMIEKVETNPEALKKEIVKAALALKENMPEAGKKSGPSAFEPCPFCAYRELGIIS